MSTNKPWGVLCCGCRGVLTAEGLLASNGGLLPFDRMLTFDTHAEADAAALAAGWQIKDAQGPNHRCPDCRVKEAAAAARVGAAPAPSRRGAYVRMP